MNAPLVEIARYPNLRLLAWQTRRTHLPEDEAFSLYEREWRHVDVAHLSAEERAFIDYLAARYGKGILNV
ncbi:hypothetical protein [uncultured Thiocystis sp.]|jgi:hypothetical protein|uniref:hypothetical protein n=1 Tax=uncultured Thiocystis sp. TaxID=1202134 RepID=UPI0025D0BE4D|nr:hypothetical protein [uncultured Thiocystis sp.]